MNNLLRINNITKKSMIFYCCGILLAVMLGISSFSLIGRYLVLIFLFVSLILPFLAKDKLTVLLWLIFLIIISPEKLYPYFTFKGYVLNSIYGIKLLNIGLIHIILIMSLSLTLFLTFFHSYRKKYFAFYNFFIYLSLILIMFYVGLIYQNNMYSILYDEGCFIYFLIFSFASTIFIERRKIDKDLSIKQLFYFIIFMLQLRSISALIIDLIYPYLGAAIYDTYLIYLNIVVILIPFISHWLFEREGSSYRFFSLIASLCAIVEIIFRPERKIFILFTIFLLLFLFGVLYNLKISKDSKLRDFYKNLNKKLKFFITLIILFFYLFLNLQISNPIIGGARYKFLTSFFFTSLAKNNPSIDLRKYEFVNIWNTLCETPFAFLFGYGAGAFFSFKYITPPTSYFGIGSYGQSQILSDSFQPHDVINFIFLKSGILGFILYSLFYLLFLKESFFCFKKSKGISEMLLFIIIFSSVPIFFTMGYFSISIACLSGVFYAFLILKYKSLKEEAK